MNLPYIIVPLREFNNVCSIKFVVNLLVGPVILHHAFDGALFCQWSLSTKNLGHCWLSHLESTFKLLCLAHNNEEYNRNKDGTTAHLASGCSTTNKETSKLKDQKRFFVVHCAVSAPDIHFDLLTGCQKHTYLAGLMN